MPSSLSVASAAPAGGPASGPPGRLKSLFTSPSVFLFVILAAQLMVVLDTTIVNVALPHIQEGLGLSGGELSWVINGYLLTFGGLLLLGARSGDLLGRRRTFLLGIAIFTVSSLFGGLAVTGCMLLSARALQGVGAALAAPSSLALLTTIFSDGPQRVRAIGLFTTVSAAGGAIGLVAGGALTQLVSWRWVMFVNVPIGIAVLLVGRIALQETPRRSGHFDIAGAVTSTLGMVGIVFGLVEAGTHGWSSPLTIGSLAVGAFLLGVFVRIETAGRGADRAVAALRQRDAHDGQRLAWADVRRHVRHVLLRRPVSPRRGGLLAPAHRPVLPSRAGVGVPVVTAGEQGAHPPGPPQGADHERHQPHRGRLLMSSSCMPGRRTCRSSSASSSWASARGPRWCP